MKTAHVNAALLLSCLLFGASANAHAQRGPGGPPPGQSGQPGGPGGVGGPGGPGGPGGLGGPGGPPPTGNNGGGPPNGRTATAPATTSTHSNTLQLGPVGRWWDDKTVMQTIGLSKDQKKKMDSIFDASKPTILGSYQALENEKAKLAALEKQPQVDQARVFAEIDAVSKARTDLEKATTQMLLQIRKQMDASQLAKLQQVH